MEVLLDTNFIISCLMKKIDFLGQLEEMGFKSVIPREVYQELKDLRVSNKISHEERVVIDVALELFQKGKVKHTKLGRRSVDEGLILKGKSGIYIATLDREIKRQIPNKIGILSSAKRVQVERD
ncbi:MAG: hypothetical protein AABX73_03990 [Nanoarchaeota archaeon]